jgi:hypothetical protein
MDEAGTGLVCRTEPLQHSLAGSHAGEGARVTVCASLARENFVKQSYGNDGAMESQHQAFQSSLGISQKTRDSHIPTAPATGCFTGAKKDSKRKNRRPFTQKT